MPPNTTMIGDVTNDLKRPPSHKQQSETTAEPSLTVLHLVGSRESRFYFECSFLYAKNACRFVANGVKNYYALLLPDEGATGPPGPGRVALLEDAIPGDLAAGDLLDGAADGAIADGTISVVSVTAFLGLLGHDRHFRHPVQLIVPHMFDRAGMTTWRMLMEDVVGLPVAGMPGSSNVVGQDKTATRQALSSLHRPGGGVGLVPKGFAIRKDEVDFADVAPLMDRVREEAGGFPVMLKSPLEDNSRGLHLVGKAYEKARRQMGTVASGKQLQALEQALTAELREKLADVFKYGDAALFEEFIPGREFRCGVIQTHNADLSAFHIGAPAAVRAASNAAAPRLSPIPVLLEYVMTNPDMPIRTAADKLSKGAQGQMVMTKCTRRYVSCHPEVCARSGKDGADAVHPIAVGLQREVEAIVRQAHEALGCGPYSLFDIRVDDRDRAHPRPYIIECCAFWSFTPMSALSLMLRAGGLDWERVVWDQWRGQALDVPAARARVGHGVLSASTVPPACSTAEKGSYNEWIAKSQSKRVAAHDERLGLDRGGARLTLALAPPAFDADTIFKETVEDYATQLTTAASPAVARIAGSTSQAGMFLPCMVGQLEGQFLKMFAQAVRAKTVLDIGTFTGYSALSFAEGLPAGGCVVTIENDKDIAKVAKRCFDASMHATKIDLRVGNAPAILEEFSHGSRQFDVIFIDADKDNYATYYKLAMDGGLLADSGCILADNTLCALVYDEDDIRRQRLHEFNLMVAKDERVEQTVLTVREGITIIRRKA